MTFTYKPVKEVVANAENVAFLNGKQMTALIPKGLTMYVVYKGEVIGKAENQKSFFNKSMFLDFDPTLEPTTLNLTKEVAEGDTVQYYTENAEGEKSETLEITRPEGVKPPVGPSQPNEPVTPDEPSEPSQPSQPNEPNEPVTPDEPSEPSQPVAPDEPTDQVKPDEPSEPSQPVTPDVPTDQVKPDEPVKSEDTTDQVKPNETTKDNEKTTDNSNITTKEDSKKESDEDTLKQSGKVGLGITGAVATMLAGLGALFVSKSKKEDK